MGKGRRPTWDDVPRGSDGKFSPRSGGGGGGCVVLLVPFVSAAWYFLSLL